MFYRHQLLCGLNAKQWRCSCFQSGKLWHLLLLNIKLSSCTRLSHTMWNVIHIQKTMYFFRLFIHLKMHLHSHKKTEKWTGKCLKWNLDVKPSHLLSNLYFNFLVTIPIKEQRWRIEWSFLSQELFAACISYIFLALSQGEGICKKWSCF